MDRLRYLIGLLTLAATAVAGWFLIGFLTDDDESGLFHLRLEFSDVRGLKPGSDVKYRGVGVGSVRSVELSVDGEKGIAFLLLQPDAAGLACYNSKFWIVVPRFRGITTGASGLDTLVRDSYVAFLTPDPPGPKLAAGSLLAGLEKPFQDEAEAALDPIRHGDLRMTLLAPESHGLKVGADVIFRGIPTGDVRAIELAADGSHVVVSLRVRQRYRNTITDTSEFWVARPRLSGALLSGLAIEDLSALLAPFVGYFSEQGRGLPVPDEYRVAAQRDRPTQADEEIPAQALEITGPAAGLAEQPAAVRVVQVVYEAEEEDWLSANDHVQRKGTGLLFIDQAGRTVVATPRSLCDASYFMDDTLGTDPDIKSEAIRVAIPEGSVLRAGRSWVDPLGGDLALLVVEGAPPDLPTTPAALLQFDSEADAGGALVLLNAGKDMQELDAGTWPAIEENRGGVAVRGDRVVGILGQKAGHDPEPVLLRLDLLPAELRPGS